MKDIDFSDMSPAAFREAIEYFTDSNNDYSKEELHSAFVVVTRLYLDELISARQLENLFVNKFGEAAADEFFEAVANSSDTVNEVYGGMSVNDDPKDVIKTQFDLLDKLSKEV